MVTNDHSSPFDFQTAGPNFWLGAQLRLSHHKIPSFLVSLSRSPLPTNHSPKTTPLSPPPKYGFRPPLPSGALPKEDRIFYSPDVCRMTLHGHPIKIGSLVCALGSPSLHLRDPQHPTTPPSMYSIHYQVSSLLMIIMDTCVCR